MERKILEKFKGKVNKVFFEKEGTFTFLRVEVKPTILEEIVALSRNISNYIDEIDNSNKEYYLDVYSSGTEKIIDINKSIEYIGKNIFIELNENIKNMDSFEGELLEAGPDTITIRWNAKGQFRKQIVEFNKIKKIKLSSKIKKEKK